MTKRALLVARGLRTRRDNSLAFRRADLAKRSSARRKRFERIGEAFMACGSVERAARMYASALHNYRRACSLMGVAL